jgi:hypothetical protein
MGECALARREGGPIHGRQRRTKQGLDSDGPTDDK